MLLYNFGGDLRAEAPFGTALPREPALGNLAQDPVGDAKNSSQSRLEGSPEIPSE